MTTIIVSLSKSISLTKFLKLYDSASFLSWKPMFFTNSELRKPIAIPLVKCACTSIMKYSSLGHFSSYAADSQVSTSSTSQ